MLASNQLQNTPDPLPSSARGRKFGIGFKLTLGVVAVALVALAVSTLLANVIITRTFGSSAETKTRETSKIITEALQGMVQELAIRTDSLANTEDFQKSLSFHEVSDVSHALSDLTKRASTDVALVIGNDGVVASSSSSPELGKTFFDARVVAEARAKHEAVRGVYPVGKDIYLLAVQPVEYIGSSLGFLVNARRFNDAVCARLSSRAAVQLALFTGDGVIGRSAQQLDIPAQQLWYALQPTDAKEAWGGRVRAGDDRFLIYAVPIRTPQGMAAGIATALSEKDILAAQERTNRGFLLISFVIGLGSVGFGLLFARRFSRPIVEITGSFGAIAHSGDLSLRINKQYPDEIGLMAQSFNQMQERIFELHQRVVTAEARMRKELEMAAVMQELLFSRTGTVSPVVEVLGYNKSSSETGGDWYAIFEDGESGRTTVVIADVTGHGAPAALITAITHGFFHGKRSELRDPTTQLVEVVSELNRTILESANGSLFMTLFICTIDHKTRKMRYVNAAHPQPLIVRTKEGRTRPVTSMPSAQLGASFDSHFTMHELDLLPGDVLFLFTDGLVECENVSGEQYGLKRLLALLNQAAKVMTPRDLRDFVVRQSFDFYGDQPIADDVTFIIGKIS